MIFKINIVFHYLKIDFVLANNADPDEIQNHVAFLPSPKELWAFCMSMGCGVVVEGISIKQRKITYSLY